MERGEGKVGELLLGRRVGNGGICFLALRGTDVPQSAFTDVGENKFHCIAYTASSKIMYHLCFHLDVKTSNAVSKTQRWATN